MRHGGATALAKLSRGSTVTAEAEGADILEIALATAFNHGNDVIGVPEAAAAACADSPVLQQLLTTGTAGAAKLLKGSDGIDGADRAATVVAQEDLLAQIRRLGAQLPLVDAVRRAEGEAAARHLKGTPAAEAATIGATGDRSAIDPSAAHRAHRTHPSSL